jgi:RimJ/RimL family protein N-acetyltransferase
MAVGPAPFLARLNTERLVLRQWRDDDRAPFAQLNSDARAMEFFPSLLTKEQSDATVDRINSHFLQHGFGLWAVEVVNGPPFIGFVGLLVPAFTAPFTPCVEIGWRLAPEHWGRGYATEGARAALEAAFVKVGLDEVVSFTVPQNARSRRVMEKLGLVRSLDEDFEHPMVPEGHPMRRHVLYRVSRSAYLTS